MPPENRFLWSKQQQQHKPVNLWPLKYITNWLCILRVPQLFGWWLNVPGNIPTMSIKEAVSSMIQDHSMEKLFWQRFMKKCGQKPLTKSWAGWDHWSQMLEYWSASRCSPCACAKHKAFLSECHSNSNSTQMQVFHNNNHLSQPVDYFNQTRSTQSWTVKVENLVGSSFFFKHTHNSAILVK